MPQPNTIAPAQLARLIGTPSAPRLIDICIDEDFAADPRLIPTARRHPFSDIVALAGELAGQRTVVVCQKGQKLSEGAAALLRCHGVAAENLAGGNFAWRDAGLPLVPAAAIPVHTAIGRTRWVTRHRPKVDRIACPWLIRRFIDPGAEILFVAPAEVRDVADRFGAVPFDVDDVALTHHGDACTFDAMLDHFALDLPALRHLAQLVRGADTGRLDMAPQAAGLLAASLGLSRAFRDDLEQLDAGMCLYDAFYHWCRDAAEERHDR